ncbi:MAG: site-specific integrase [Spirochaetes bacterium]|nr:site-specific integrase [Spirochaetota bacterium]
MSIRKVREHYNDGIRIGVYDLNATVLGKRIRKRISATTKQSANELYRRWLGEIQSGKYEYRLYDKLNEYLKYAKEHKSARAFYKEQMHIALFKSFFNDIALNNFKGQFAEDYIVWRKKHRKNGKRELSNAAINRDRSTLNYFFNWCIRREYYVGVNPVAGTRLKETNIRVVSLPSEELGRIIDASKGHLKTAIMLAIFTGMRHGEICGLKWSQVDLTNGLIHLEAYETKSKRRREIPMPDILLDYLKAILDESPQSSHVVMYNASSVLYIKKSWNALRRKLSLVAPDGSPLRFHDLRHCYATALRMAGRSLSEIQEHLGHKDIQTTQRYAHFDGRAMRERVKCLNDLLPVRKSVPSSQLAVNDDNTENQEKA